MTDKINASPAAQKLARANKLDLGEIKGSGHGKQVTKPDVEAELEKRQAATAASNTQSDDPPAEAHSSGEPEAERTAPEPEEPQPASGQEQGQAPPKPPAELEEVAEETAKAKGTQLPIVKLTDNLGVAWWCPFDDFSQPGEHFTCGGCGAKRDGGPTAALGDMVSAA